MHCKEKLRPVKKWLNESTQMESGEGEGEAADGEGRQSAEQLECLSAVGGRIRLSLDPILAVDNEDSRARYRKWRRPPPPPLSPLLPSLHSLD